MNEDEPKEKKQNNKKKKRQEEEKKYPQIKRILDAKFFRSYLKCSKKVAFNYLCGRPDARPYFEDAETQTITFIDELMDTLINYFAAYCNNEHTKKQIKKMAEIEKDRTRARRAELKKQREADKEELQSSIEQKVLANINKRKDDDQDDDQDDDKKRNDKRIAKDKSKKKNNKFDSDDEEEDVNEEDVNEELEEIIKPNTKRDKRDEKSVDDEEQDVVPEIELYQETTPSLEVKTIEVEKNVKDRSKPTLMQIKEFLLEAAKEGNFVILKDNATIQIKYQDLNFDTEKKHISISIGN